MSILKELDPLPDYLRGPLARLLSDHPMVCVDCGEVTNRSAEIGDIRRALVEATQVYRCYQCFWESSPHARNCRFLLRHAFSNLEGDPSGSNHLGLAQGDRFFAWSYWYD
jgi:hypothetical protein